MATVNVAKGKKFLKRGDKLKAISIILQGSVVQVTKTDEWTMESGSIIGIMECITGLVSCDYVAKEDCVFYTFPYRTQEDYRVILEEQPKYAYVFIMGAAKQTDMLLGHYLSIAEKAHTYYMFCSQMYQEYEDLCSKYGVATKNFHRMDCVEPFEPASKTEPWKVKYYKGLSKISLSKMQQFYGTDYDMCMGEILNAASTMQRVAKLVDELQEYVERHKDILFEPEKNDMLSLYFDLQCNCARQNLDCPDVKEHMDKIKKFIVICKYYDMELVRERLEEYESYNAAEDSEQGEVMENIEDVDCLTKILMYAYFETDKIEHVKELFQQFKALPDKLATTDEVRKLRREITNVFFEAYEAAFRRSLEDKRLSSIIKMFLNFGFMDVSLVGEETAVNLQSLTERLNKCRSDNVYTMYEWLKSIYEGKNEPSKNEFDVDYTGHLLELRKNGSIDRKQQDVMQEDIWAKVQFELQNMFRSTSRITYGKYSTYCPVLCDWDIINSVENMLVTVEKLDEALNDIRKVDYSCFYREVVFTDPDHEITREYIQKEVLPDIILVPNVGTKAMMWQETAGTRRDTAARFVFPMMTMTSIPEMMLETAGRFRWEMCRKIQGMRWNDIRERSLTSEYCDYIQFYRKNHDLSADAKEKIKNALTKAKNNYREVFVKDYQSWLKFESKGSFRLNKVARDIIFRYCPFGKEIRDSLGVNPMYKEMFGKFEILKQRKMRHVESVYSKYQQCGGEMTPELQDNLDFYHL